VTMNSVSDFLNQGSGSGYPGVKFNQVGDEVKGTIISDPRIVETPSLKDGAPEPKLVLEVHTEVDSVVSDGEGGDKTVTDEDVALWVRKGWMSGAVRDAVQKAGASNIEQGGRIHVKLVELRKPTKVGFNPTKIFEAVYKAPDKPSGVSLDDL
jgi:hypothetical protein